MEPEHSLFCGGARSLMGAGARWHKETATRAWHSGLWGTAIIAVAVCLCTCRRKPGQLAYDEGVVDDSQIPVLVNQLASTRQDATNPCVPGYDWREVSRVEGVRRKLFILGLRAVPELVRHLDDRRYSMSVDFAQIVPLNVGQMCVEIVEDVVLCRTCRSCRKDVQWVAEYFGTAESSDNVTVDLAGWWAKNRGHTLRELRIMAAEHAAAMDGCDRKAINAELEGLRRGDALSLEEEAKRTSGLQPDDCM
jgi:hypothetical protein